MVRRKPRRKPLGTIWEISDELSAADRADPLGILDQETDWAEGRAIGGKC